MYVLQIGFSKYSANLQTIIDESKESFFYEKMRIENNEFRTSRYKIIALVKLEKLDEDLRFVLF